MVFVVSLEPREKTLSLVGPVAVLGCSLEHRLPAFSKSGRISWLAVSIIGLPTDLYPT